MDEHINHPILKASIAAASFVSIQWLDWLTTFGKVCAALTAIVIFGELVWKKALHPLCYRMGWIKPKTHWVDE